MRQALRTPQLPISRRPQCRSITSANLSALASELTPAPITPPLPRSSTPRSSRCRRVGERHVMEYRRAVGTKEADHGARTQFGDAPTPGRFPPQWIEFDDWRPYRRTHPACSAGPGPQWIVLGPQERSRANRSSRQRPPPSAQGAASRSPGYPSDPRRSAFGHHKLIGHAGRSPGASGICSRVEARQRIERVFDAAVAGSGSRRPRGSGSPDCFTAGRPRRS